MTNSYSSLIHNFIGEEIAALNNVNEKSENEFDPIVDELLNIKGKLIFMGVGKSGLIGRKLAATFSSTGTPSFFVHATESVHGDLGMIEENDTVILISNSGETKEIIAPIKSLNTIGSKTIAFTGNPESTLAKLCDLTLTIHVNKEADKLNLAPTNSSTAVLVVGDAIACTLSELKGFSKDDFATFHPGGALGKKLLSTK
ncbi:KpsF/GutQ family sugar-phosphate isomerase [Companilactobacillus halodurans]|uniref:SIS domain-containing protein n=1 Tax=Companilactobacillus halodurans TaxID=2584183 RepID=A0A5P0ZWW0_9LACO|nr:SIS domain-containing protein [Companilactobacillus halodurans]MQS75153.1 SIS domain-containing protein [Companilactobacillus halodurans]MQS97583.1 SIS domain-containing protein [Companilactobacillus halodurans]